MNNKYISIIGILLGLLLNIYTFFLDGENMIFIFLIGLSGFAISTLMLIKHKNGEKILNLIGIISNLIPVIYLLIVFIKWY